MKWQAYPAYKDSGIVWLDRIPTHWKTTHIKHLASSDYKSFIDGDWIESPYITDEGIRLVQTGNIGVGQYREQGYRYISEDTFNKLVCTEVMPGDVLICRLAAPVGRACVAPNLGVRMITSVDVCILKPQSNYNPRHIVYSLSNEAYLHWMESLSRGSTRARISRSMLGDIEFVAPPLPEQRAIAAFLDHKTAHIDALIAKKERQIELFQEKRAALISHAVTKGLDPSVPMKDSGVEWLGEIPTHWEMKRLKFIAAVQSGVAKGRNLEGRETIDLPYLRVANVQRGYVDLSDVATITIGKDEVDRYALRKGDILMTEGGDYDKLGRGAVWEGQITPCIHQNHIFAVRAHRGRNPYWISAITQADYARHYFILHSKQSTNLASISSTNIMELSVVLPPFEQQDSILSFLDRETAQIDSLIAKVRESIERLQEYRTALISAAVTGKIDVRET